MVEDTIPTKDVDVFATGPYQLKNAYQVQDEQSFDIAMSIDTDRLKKDFFKIIKPHVNHQYDDDMVDKIVDQLVLSLF